MASNEDDKTTEADEALKGEAKAAPADASDADHDEDAEVETSGGSADHDDAAADVHFRARRAGHDCVPSVGLSEEDGASTPPARERVSRSRIIPAIVPSLTRSPDAFVIQTSHLSFPRRK